MKPAAAFFDLDGTLMDREPLAQAAVKQLAANHGVFFTDEQLAPLVGRAWQDVHLRLEIEQHLSWDLAEFLDGVVSECDVLVRDGFETRILDGGVELIERLAGDGVPVWLVTGSLRREADIAIRQLGIGATLSGSLAAEEYGRGKPDPECYLTAARLVGLGVQDHGRCLVVEDSAAGVQAGVDAGMRVLATSAANRPSDHPSHQDLRAAHAVVDSLAEVDDALLARLFGDVAPIP